MKLLLSFAFRPCFLLMGIYALLGITSWWLQLDQKLAWPADFPARLRHGHEMLFGFAGAAIAGFLLTAVATWTGRPAVAGGRLAVLVLFWLVARLGAFLPGPGGFTVWALGSFLFWAWLTGLMAREVLSVRQARNYKVPVVLAIFSLAEIVFFGAGQPRTELMETGLRAGLSLVIGLILLVGGRIIPNFTQNWLRQRRPKLQTHIPPFDAYDRMTVLLFLVFSLAFTLRPEAGITGGLGIAAALTQAVRLLRWRGWLAAREPLLWILHLGYLWIPVGFVLLGLAALGLPRLYDAGLHALTYGAMGTLILGVAARVALGHTGRPLTASPGMTLAFWLITLGAGLRILAPFGGAWMMLSIPLWIAAYALFLVRYVPILLAPRIDAGP